MSQSSEPENNQDSELNNEIMTDVNIDYESPELICHIEPDFDLF